MAIVLGTPGDDTRSGTPGHDTIATGGGRDTVHARGGDDTVRGGDGRDWLHGEDGSDRLYGHAGGDRLLGGRHLDWLWGGTGSDTLWGGAEADRVLGGAGVDSLFGGLGRDRLEGGAGDDALHGGPGFDTAVYAGERAGYRVVLGDDGTVTVTDIDSSDGDDGSDRLQGVERLRFADQSLDPTLPVIDIVSPGPNLESALVLRQQPDFTFDATTYANGLNLRQAVLGDMNHDGRLDIVGGSGAVAGDLALLLQQADGSFIATPLQPTSTTSVFAQELALGDLNGDGDLDVAVADAIGSGLTVVLSDGRGGYGLPQRTGIGTSPKEVALGDLDGDGDLDAAVGSFADSIAILINDGRGAFTAADPVALRGEPTQVVLGDLDGDRRLDLVATTTDEDWLAISTQQADGSFVTTVRNVGDDPHAPVLADIDGDGRLDIALLVDGAGGTPSLGVLLQQADGSFAQTDFALPLGYDGISLALGDITRDGRVDAVITVTNGTDEALAIAPQLADGTFAMGYRIDTALGGRPALGDLDGPQTRTGLPWLGPDIPIVADVDWVA